MRQLLTAAADRPEKPVRTPDPYLKGDDGLKYNDDPACSHTDAELMISWGKNKSVRTNSPGTASYPAGTVSRRDELQREGGRAVLAGCNTGTDTGKYARAMAELRGLAEACELSVLSVVIQNTDSVTHATYMGSGKVLELKKAVEESDADIVLFNESLTPMQTRNLEKILDTEVLDRTGLILQIFAMRARTREAKLQVESAQLQYMLPRLAGMRTNLSRQGGGSGRLSNKGAGEQKLELDRRRIEHRLAELRRELDIVSRERATQRNRRMRTGMTRVALVGYTNAGKSTVMNALLRFCAGTAGSFPPFSSGPGSLKPAGTADPALPSPAGTMPFKGIKDRSLVHLPAVTDFPAAGNSPAIRDHPGSKSVFEADMLFATLDTSVRRIDAPGHIPFLLSDTVGFVSDLPHTLVKAFRSTLDEVCCADLLLEVVDFSDPDYRRQIEVTARTLEEIGAGHIPVVYLYNKTDLAMGEKPMITKSRPVPAGIPYRRGEILYLAAGKEIGIPDILTLIDDALGEGRTETEYFIPYKKGALLQEIRRCGVLLSEEYLPEGIHVRVRCRKEDAVRISRLCAE